MFWNEVLLLLKVLSTWIKWQEASERQVAVTKSEKLSLRSNHRRCSLKKGVLKNFAKFTGKHLCQSLFFNKVAETLAQVFSCEFCEIFKNTFFIEHL